jgi:diguanylate cyclase (GGDEF)-like protein
VNRIFRFFAPQGVIAGAAMVAVLICVIAGADLLFIYIVDGQISRPVRFYVLQAIFVGGPFVVLFVWVTSYQLRLQRRLSLLSRKDGLTGLNNRRTFVELAEKRIAGGEAGVLILLDADHFKKVNDTWGHAAGDRCLKEIAHRLKFNLRPGDVAGRIGGEEFAVLLSGATLHQARVIASRIGQPIPFTADDCNQHKSVTLSMGAVEIMADVSLGVLLNHADEALYQAKEAGRAQLKFWVPPSSDDAAA